MSEPGHRNPRSAAASRHGTVRARRADALGIDSAHEVMEERP